MNSLKTNVCIVGQLDPFGSNISGIATFIKGFIKYAPEHIDIMFIGISSDKKKRPPGKWIISKIGEKEFRFFPLFYEKEENKKKLIPLSLRFSIRLFLSKFELYNRILIFNRIENATAFINYSNPKISIVHNDIVKQLMKNKSENYWSIIPGLYKLFEKFVFHRLELIYTVNKDALEYYYNRYLKIKERILFIPTWVDNEIFYPAQESKMTIRNRLNLTDKISPIHKNWILFVGRLQEQKAPLRLINTFAEVRKLNNKSCLIIIGLGNYEKKMKELVKKLHLEESVYFLGYKNQYEIAQYYKASDILLVVSNFEGMPISVLEALGSGLPVVSTDAGEIKMLIRSCYSGEVVTSFLPSVIAASVIKISENLSQYKKGNCISCVTDYYPQKVLKPFYEKLSCLSKNNNSPDIINIGMTNKVESY